MGLSGDAFADDNCTGDAGFEACSGTTEDIGDFLQYALPISALGSSLLLGDKEGTYQYLWAGGSSLVSVGLGKGIYSKLRPTTASETSFPSGHTAAAFFGASFIYARYENAWGWVAYGLAAYTGYSRVWADAHFLDDVVAGASLGTLWSLYYTTPYGSSDRVSLMPMQVKDGYGLVLNFRDYKSAVHAEAGDDDKIDWFSIPSRAVRSVNPQNTFTFGFGPAYLREQQISGGPGGTTFNLYDFNREDDPTATASIALEVNLPGKHSVAFLSGRSSRAIRAASAVQWFLGVRHSPRIPASEVHG